MNYFDISKCNVGDEVAVDYSSSYSYTNYRYGKVTRVTKALVEVQVTPRATDNEMDTTFCFSRTTGSQLRCKYDWQRHTVVDAATARKREAYDKEMYLRKSNERSLRNAIADISKSDMNILAVDELRRIASAIEAELARQAEMNV